MPAPNIVWIFVWICNPEQSSLLPAEDTASIQVYWEISLHDFLKFDSLRRHRPVPCCAEKGSLWVTQT